MTDYTKDIYAFEGDIRSLSKCLMKNQKESGETIDEIEALRILSMYKSKIKLFEAVMTANSRIAGDLHHYG